MKQPLLTKGEMRAKELKIASLRVQIMHANDRKAELVKAEKYSEAEVCKCI
jgi:hypothetical protein